MSAARLPSNRAAAANDPYASSDGEHRDRDDAGEQPDPGGDEQRDGHRLPPAAQGLHSAQRNRAPVRRVGRSGTLTVMQVVILAGGVGGSRFVAGARQAFPDADITVVVNTADDITLYGLRICPDLDTMMYALGGGIDPERGWGRSRGELADPRRARRLHRRRAPWFGLGDRDLATHLLPHPAAGRRPDAWPRSPSGCAPAGCPIPGCGLLPMTNDRVESHIVIPDAERGRRTVHFQEYWVRLHAEPEALAVLAVGLDAARPTPGLLERIAAADLILLAPSNPVVSIGPILGVPGVRQAAARQPRRRIIGFAGHPGRRSGAGHGAPPAAGHRGRGRRRRRRAALRRPSRRRASWTSG